MIITVNTKKRGFTLVETLVAVSIFSISIIGLMSVLGKGISDTNFARQKVIASYLAQEGLEYVRNFRDTYVVSSPDSNTGWSNFIASLNSGGCSSGCGFRDNLSDYNINNLNNSTFFTCENGCAMNYDSAFGSYFYNQFSSSGVSSGFTRRITFIQPDGAKPEEIRVSSNVSWTKGGYPHSVTFSTNLLKWVE